MQHMVTEQCAVYNSAGRKLEGSSLDTEGRGGGGGLRKVLLIPYSSLSSSTVLLLLRPKYSCDALLAGYIAKRGQIGRIRTESYCVLTGQSIKRRVLPYTETVQGEGTRESIFSFGIVLVIIVIIIVIIIIKFSSSSVPRLFSNDRFDCHQRP